MQLLREFPDESFDCILTDPPYPSLERYRVRGTTTRLGGHLDPARRDAGRWFRVVSNDELALAIREFHRLLKRDRHCYVMCDYETLRVVHAAAAGLFQHVAPLVWDKEVPGMGYHYRRSFEFIVMLDKGKNRRLNNLGVRDVLRFRQLPCNACLVPTQKPVALFEVLIAQSTRPGEFVFDPFVGSGTTCLAARRLGRRYIGIELQTRFVDLARSRCGSPD